MDVLLSQVTKHAMNYAIRSGMTIATGYTIKQCSILLQTTPQSREKEEIAQLHLRLEAKIRIISPAIDMIELITARGHTTLESAVSLTKDIRHGIQTLGQHLAVAAEEEELASRRSKRAKNHGEIARTLVSIIMEMKALIDKIDDAVPLVNLAITTSGVNLSTKLSTNISPSRLLQASTFLTAADTEYALTGLRTQVGPTFLVSLYMLFGGHAQRPIDEAGIREMTWKEVVHKAHAKLFRAPLEETSSLEVTQADCERTCRADRSPAEYAYQLLLVEDFDDDRVHNFEPEDRQPEEFCGVSKAGIREIVPVHEVAKLFYADTGKILSIQGDDVENTPVLLLKRDTEALPPRRMMHEMIVSDEKHFSVPIIRPSSDDSQQEPNHLGYYRPWGLPADLDSEWMALEVYSIPDDDSEPEDNDSAGHRGNDWALSAALATLTFRQSSASPADPERAVSPLQSNREASVKTSLSLLEMLIKLAALQQFRQESHLAIEDELLHFFLEESATAGSDDKDRRQRIRQAAIKKVGFDPYDESPSKRHTGYGGSRRTVSSSASLASASTTHDNAASPGQSSSPPLTEPSMPLLERLRQQHRILKQQTLLGRTIPDGSASPDVLLNMISEQYRHEATPSEAQQSIAENTPATM